MPARPLNILLVGGESAGVQTLRLLNDSPHNIAAVMAEPGQNARQSPLRHAAKKQGLEVFPAEQIRYPEFAATVLDYEVDVLLNVHSLHRVPAEVLDACCVGAFNLHPGPLPEYAGLDVPSWAIYHGETTHAVTLHEMVPRIDAGVIAYQSRFDIRLADTGLTLMSRCIRSGMPLVKSLLDDLYQDPTSVPRIEQDPSKRQYFYRKAPGNGWMNWNRPAQNIVDHIRAADFSPFPSPWGHPRSLNDGIPVGLVRATITSEPAAATPGTVGGKSTKGRLVAASDLWVDVQLVESEGQIRQARDVLTAGILHGEQQASNSTEIPAANH